MIDKDYFDFTYSFKQFYIFIYKSYYVSDQKTKQVSIFVRKYITRISQVQKLQDSKLLSNIRKISIYRYALRYAMIDRSHRVGSKNEIK